MKNIVLLFLGFPFLVFGQFLGGKLTLEAHGEFYYSFDMNQPENHEKPNFLVNYSKHNEIGPNLILVQGKYQEEKFRANLGLMLGNYVTYNLGSEPQWAQFIYQANIGVKLSKKHNLWLDLGIFESHLGFESVIGTSNATLTRSLCSELSPYYESGLRLNYTSPQEKLYIALLYLNGWQRIDKLPGMQYPNFGMQITYKPNDNFKINYSNFLGFANPNQPKWFRHFHNLFAQIGTEKKGQIILGLDLGQDRAWDSVYRFWYSPTIIYHKLLHKQFELSLRAEYYSDPYQVNYSFVNRGANGLEAVGLSTNVDYKFNQHITFRFEPKYYLFLNEIPQYGNRNLTLTASMSIDL